MPSLQEVYRTEGVPPLVPLSAAEQRTIAARHLTPVLRELHQGRRIPGRARASA